MKTTNFCLRAPSSLGLTNASQLKGQLPDDELSNSTERGPTRLDLDVSVDMLEIQSVQTNSSRLREILTLQIIVRKHIET